MKQITKLPQPPTTAEPQNFDDRADAFVGALPAFVTETNELAAEVEESLQTVQTLKENADASKQAAQTSAQTASEAKEAAARSASEAESSAQAAEQIKTQTQEIKQSAQEALAIIAAAAQSSAQAARQSEQAAEQTKTELQTATQTLQDMKSIVKDGFIDDSAQSETKTYSSHKIVELNEALSADVTQEIKRVDEGIRADAIKGNLNLPSPFESDLAMWDYMEITPVAVNRNCDYRTNTPLEKIIFGGDVNLYINDNRCCPFSFEKSSEVFFFPTKSNQLYLDKFLSILIDDDKAYIVLKNYVFSKEKGTQNFSRNSQTPDIDPLQSFESKYMIYLDTSRNEAYVYAVDAAAGTLKFVFKKKIDDEKLKDKYYAYVAFNHLKIGDFTFKITDTDLTLASEGEIYLPKRLEGEIRAPFHRSSPGGFIISGGYVYDVKSGKVLKGVTKLKLSGFLGRTDYLLIKSLSDEYYYPSYIYDVKYGARWIRMPEYYYPVSVSLKDGYAYILFMDVNSRNPSLYISGIRMAVKIPMKFLTGKNYKG